MSETNETTGRGRRWLVGITLVALVGGTATGTALGIFAYGDRIGDRALIVGWRLKNAATRVEWDGTLAPVSAAAVEVAARRICEDALREQLRQADAEVRAADTYLRPITTKPNARKR